MLGIPVPVAMREVAATTTAVSMALVPARWLLFARATRRDHMRCHSTTSRNGTRSRRCVDAVLWTLWTSAGTATPAAATPASAAVLATLRTTLPGGRARARRHLRLG